MKIQSILIALISFFVFCLNAQDIEWQKSLGGSDQERAFSIQQTSDGGYIVAGESQSNDGDVSGNHGESDAWVIKLDPQGNLVWQKCLGGSVGERALSIQQTSDGGYIVAGRSNSNDGDVSGHHGGGDYWIVKLDVGGNLIWQKCLGGSGDDLALSIQQTSDGGYIVAGLSSSNDGDVSGNHGYYDYWIVKLDSNGNLIWQKCLGGSGRDDAFSIQQTIDEGYIAAGSSFSNDGDVSGNHGDYDYWIVKLDVGGNLIWQKCLGGSSLEQAISIQQTSDGGYIVAGLSSSNDGDVSGNHGGADYWVVKLDPDGNLVWQKCLGGSGLEFAFSIQQTSDEGYIVAGYSFSNDGDVSGNHGDYDYWIVKLDVGGNLIWQKCLGGSGDDLALSIQQTSDGGYIVAGYSFSNDGDVSGNHGGEDYWIVKLTSVATATNNIEIDLNILLYPNPTSDILIIESEKELTNPFITISTLDGKLLFQNRYGSSNQISVNVSSIPTGIYSLEIRSNEQGQQGFVTKKIFIE